MWSEHLPPCDLHPLTYRSWVHPLGSSRKTNSASLSPPGNPLLLPIPLSPGQASLLFQVGFPCCPCHLQSSGAPTQGSAISTHVWQNGSSRGRVGGRDLLSPQAADQGPNSRGKSLRPGSAKVCQLSACLVSTPAKGRGQGRTPGCSPPWWVCPIAPGGRHVAPTLCRPTVPGSDLTSQRHFLWLATDL